MIEKQHWKKRRSKFQWPSKFSQIIIVPLPPLHPKKKTAINFHNVILIVFLLFILLLLFTFFFLKKAERKRITKGCTGRWARWPPSGPAHWWRCPARRWWPPARLWLWPYTAAWKAAAVAAEKAAVAIWPPRWWRRARWCRTGSAPRRLSTYPARTVTRPTWNGIPGPGRRWKSCHLPCPSTRSSRRPRTITRRTDRRSPYRRPSTRRQIQRNHFKNV